LSIAQGPRPFVILVVGVNGSGKTTTIGKLAHRFGREGREEIRRWGRIWCAASG